MPGWYAGYVLHLEATNTIRCSTTRVSRLRHRRQASLDRDRGCLRPCAPSSSPSGSSRATISARSALVSSRRLLITQPSWLTVRARSFPPTGCCSTTPFFIRNNGALTGVTWGGLGRCALSGQAIGGDCEAIPTNVIRYDSPTFAGFSLSADWGEQSNGFFPSIDGRHPGNDGGYWDIYGRYSGEYNGIKIAATTGFSHDNHVMSLQLAPIPGWTAAGPSWKPGTVQWRSGRLLAVRFLCRARCNRRGVLGQLW